MKLCLLIESDTDHRKALRKWVEAEGYSCVDIPEVNSASIAYQCLMPDVVLMGRTNSLQERETMSKTLTQTGNRSNRPAAVIHDEGQSSHQIQSMLRYHCA